ncbi:hypothetical protein SteCoe_4369 [Stentor coeruleus]|uniref:Uncharacterized protein n=1 Tax=Stentor coeruleus TaxID=5963 RepID=A0A1R2CV20_9CILI|nr:hypothetical protein SteCoe_4369 [Stentor coeruleus]
MGCRSSRLNNDAIKLIPPKKETKVKKIDENSHQVNEENSEFSLRDCSIIPIVTENGGKRRVSDDPSIIGMIQEIRQPSDLN